MADSVWCIEKDFVVFREWMNNMEEYEETGQIFRGIFFLKRFFVTAFKLTICCV